MPRDYAVGTKVGVDSSRTEIERLLRRFGAEGFGYAWQGRMILFTFQIGETVYRINTTLPTADDAKARIIGQARETKRAIPNITPAEALEQETTRLYRSLALYVKALLVAVSDGIFALENVLFPYTVMPSGQTVEEWYAPQLKQVQQGQKAPPMLPGIGGTR